MPETERKGQLDGWFILELFGHQRIAGRVSEVTLGTNVMLRVDVPLSRELTKREPVASAEK